jgi:hypothetical protein
MEYLKLGEGEHEEAAVVLVILQRDIPATLHETAPSIRPPRLNRLLFGLMEVDDVLLEDFLQGYVSRRDNPVPLVQLPASALAQLGHGPCTARWGAKTQVR